MADVENNSDIAAMSFEQALDQLEKIVDDLERGDVPLEQSIRIYERGEALKKHCDTLLSAAEDKVQKIRLGRNGEPVGTEPLDPECSTAMLFSTMKNRYAKAPTPSE
jgi:exodeoxyribonuclease VII small subunit